MKKINLILLVVAIAAMLIILVSGGYFLFNKYYNPTKLPEPPKAEEANKTADNLTGIRAQYTKECLEAMDDLGMTITSAYLCRSEIFSKDKKLCIIKNGRDVVLYSYKISEDSLFYLATLKDLRFTNVTDTKIYQTGIGYVVGIRYGFVDAGGGFWEIKYFNTNDNSLNFSTRAEFNLVENSFSIKYNDNIYKIEPVFSSGCDQRKDSIVKGTINDFKLNGVPLNILKTPLEFENLCGVTVVKEIYITVDENGEPKSASVHFYNDIFMLDVDLTLLKNKGNPIVKFELYW